MNVEERKRIKREASSLLYAFSFDRDPDMGEWSEKARDLYLVMKDLEPDADLHHLMGEFRRVFWNQSK